MYNFMSMHANENLLEMQTPPPAVTTTTTTETTTTSTAYIKVMIIITMMTMQSWEQPLPNQVNQIMQSEFQDVTFFGC